MGRSPKPLSLLVHPDLVESAEVQELIGKGHTVTIMGSEVEHDLMLGPRCWHMDTRLVKYLDLAVKAARTIKYPKEKKK